MSHPPPRTRKFDPVSFSLFAAKVVVVLVLAVTVLGEAPRAGLLVPAGLVCLVGVGSVWSFLRTRRRVEAMREQYLRTE